MALTKCPECKKDISSKAISCPHCGYAKSKPTQFGCGALILVVAFIMVVLGAMFDNRSPRPQTSAQTTTPKTAEEARREKIALAFSPWDGSHRNLENYVKSHLKDPDSYQHIKTIYGDKGETITVLMQYRAKNSFGGYVVKTANATTSIDGTLLSVEIGE